MPYQFSATPLYVEEGQSVQFRYQAPLGYDEITQVTIQIGELEVFWIIETKLEDFSPDPFFLRNVDPAEKDVLYTYAATADPDDGVAYTGLVEGETPPLREGEQVITITGLDPTTQAPLVVTSNALTTADYGYRIRRYNSGTSSYDAWGAWTTAFNDTVSNLDQIQVRLRSSTASSDTRTVNVAVGSGFAEWEIDTGTPPVNTPNPAPDFGNLNNQELNALVYSEIPQILGLSTDAIISVDNGGEIAVANFNTTFTNASGFSVLDNIVSGWGNNLTVSNGQYVQLRGTTSSNSQTPINFSVTVGDGANISGWEVRTGDGVNTVPTSWTFQNLVNQIPGQTNIRSEANAGSTITLANSRVVALIQGLTDGISVPVVLRESDTTATNPRISVNGGSTGGFSNVTVQNGDYIELVVDNSLDVSDPTVPGQGAVAIGINVGSLFVQTWSVTNWEGPDTTPAFTPINQVINRTPGGVSVVGPIGLTDFNLPITISATAPESYNEFNFATGEDVGEVLFSINGDAAVAGPRTVDPDPGGDPVFITIILQQPGNANIDPVVGLSHFTRTTITFGDATPFQLDSVNYAVKPIPPAYLGVWYSEKNAYFDDEAWEAAGEDPNDARDYYRSPKFDGYSIGTVVSIVKETPLDDGNFGYGDLEGDLNSRYPGFLPCDGRILAAADYPWLWEAIGNQYGGNATYIAATKSYTGNFNLPDYRNVRMVGAGIVDANRGSSSFVVATSDGGSYEIPGSTGGYWYVDDVDVAGPDPLEQIIAPAGQTTGVDSTFFTLGSPRTFGTEEVTTEVDFTINGNATGTMGPVSDISVREPQHRHTYIVGQIEDEDGDPVIPWGARAYYATNVSASYSERRGDDVTNAVNDGIWEEDFPWRNSFSTTDQEVQDSGRGDLLDLLPGTGSNNVAFGNYWGSPASAITGLSDDYFTKSGTPTDAGVIDTEYQSARINDYESIYSGLLNHSHLLGLDPVLDPQADFTYGNVNSDATAIRQGLPNFNSTFTVQFSQSEVDLELNTATFAWNNTTKPVPTVSMDPQRKVPILAPFHKIKYIIKAF